MSADSLPQTRVHHIKVLFVLPGTFCGRLDQNQLPLKVDLIEALQQPQFLVDGFQFDLEKLGLFRIGRESVQLLLNLLSDLQVLVIDGVQLFVQTLEAIKYQINQEISHK